MTGEQKLRNLLSSTEIVLEDKIFERIRQSSNFAVRMFAARELRDAILLYQDALKIPQTSTKMAVLRNDNVSIGEILPMEGCSQAMFFWAFEGALPCVLKVPLEWSKVEAECQFYTNNRNAAEKAPLVPVKVLIMDSGSYHSPEHSPTKVIQKGILMPKYSGCLFNNPIPLSNENALQVGGRILDALTCMHDCGYFHGDVKPGNIFLDSTGEAWLGDYGSSVKIVDVKNFVGGTARYQCMEVPAYTDVGQEKISSRKFDLMGLALTLLEKLGKIALDDGVGVTVSVVKDSIDAWWTPFASEDANSTAENLKSLLESLVK